MQTASLSNSDAQSAPVKGVSVFEHVVICICLLLFSQALLGKMFSSPMDLEGPTFLRLIWLPIYAYTIAVIVLRWPLMLAAMIRSPLLLILPVMAILSMMWSIDPPTSLRRGIAIFFTTMFAFYLAISLSWRELLRNLGIAWLILGVGTVISALAVPQFGVMQSIHPGHGAGFGLRRMRWVGILRGAACFMVSWSLWISPGLRFGPEAFLCPLFWS